jgi:hypothetical protein
MTTLYSPGYRSTAFPVHSSYTKEACVLWHEQCVRSQNDQRGRRPPDSRSEVLLPTSRLRERGYAPRHGRGRAIQSQTKTLEVPRTQSPQAQLAQRSDFSTRREESLSSIYLAFGTNVPKCPWTEGSSLKRAIPTFVNQSRIPISTSS